MKEIDIFYQSEEKFTEEFIKEKIFENIRRSKQISLLKERYEFFLDLNVANILDSYKDVFCWLSSYQDQISKLSDNNLELISKYQQEYDQEVTLKVFPDK